MSTSSTSQQPAVKEEVPVQRLPDSERTRLIRKEGLKEATQLAQTLSANLTAWLIIALNIERAQIQGDRVGAMFAIAQQPPRQPTLPASVPPQPRASVVTGVAVKVEPPPPPPPPTQQQASAAMSIDQEDLML